jgi:3-methyl-2-oxobutanoate hydroxymethyltransferase
VQGVKVEGNKTRIIRALLDQRIPVMGHVGLLPQTAKSYSVQGREPPEAEAILRDAIALDDLGVFAIVLECIPEKLSRQITDSVKASTIGIGAGKYCDGQVLVTYDILGLLGAVKPKYVKEYADLTGSIKAAVSQFRLDVINGKYPDPKHTYH